MKNINLEGKWSANEGALELEFKGNEYTMTLYEVKNKGTFILQPDEKRNQTDIILSNNPTGLSIYMTYDDENQMRFEFRHNLKREL